MITLEPVLRTNVRAAWPVLRLQLEQLLRNEPQHWLPEDVYIQLMQNNSFLHWVLVDGEKQGFIITRPTAEFDRLVLFVWILYVTPHAIPGGFHGDMLAPLDELARSIGAQRIRHESSRNGWSAKGMFEAKARIYEREV